jgi:hypothetical protein
VANASHKEGFDHIPIEGRRRRRRPGIIRMIKKNYYSTPIKISSLTYS